MPESEDFNAKLFIKLYSKIALALGVTSIPSSDVHAVPDTGRGDPSDIRPPLRSSLGYPGQNPEYLLAIYNPGQYVPASLNPDEDVDDRYALSVLLDVVPQFSWVFKQAAGTVSSNYRSILDNKQPPVVHLSPEEKKKLDDSLQTYDAYAEVYEEYYLKYLDALDALDSAKATYRNDRSKPVPSSLYRRLDKAEGDWIARGHREAVEAAVAVIAEYEAMEPALFWRKLQQRYAAGTQENSQSSEFQLVGYSPAYRDWFKDAGWTSFTFSQKDMDNQSRSDAIGVSGNLDLSYGIFRISGEGSYEKDSVYVKMDETELDFSCELMRVSLDRRWMNPLLFWSRAWRWAPSSPLYGTEFSSGGSIADAEPPQGAMTVIPTAVILSRNLRIRGRFEDTLVERMNLEIRANASVGIGPFSISGQFAMEEHSESVRGTIAADGIEAPDVQIIAMICEVLPKCPDPDSTLPWPN
ncbi:hypothetical protein [Gellertiella hungarica]|uniref:Uncharacterized protein n=1 Tax=Gellertiella hungarica TaxID=1572859 RepID=A0A7W6J601_9HYPH|nr:hypothetical protein [Gellertiella hungarica]MBB4065412.1 hypothetical protein [Gellertiella hungarica]